MKKVVYSVAKYGKNVLKITGIGYITEEDLISATVSKNGNPYVRLFEDCVKRCKKVQGKTNEFQGYITEIHEVDIFSSKYLHFKLKKCFYVL